MRVLFASDCFGGTLSAAEAVAAMTDGWREARPGDVVTALALSDGGPGFLDALPGVRVTALVRDPLGRPTLATFLLDGETAYVESAQAAGLHLLDPTDRDPSRTTTFGVGQLVRLAVDAGATRVVVGVGGTATNDGGRGFLDAAGDLHGVALAVATDVESPLLGPSGATAVFAPQKGAQGSDLAVLEARMVSWADELEARTGRRVRDQAGAGAGGGLGFAFLALGAERDSGFAVVAAALSLGEAVAAADLVVTGEGRLDGSSLQGKVVAGVSRLAAEHAVPCVVLAGEVLLGRREAAAAGFAETHSLVDLVGPEQAFTDAARALRECSSRLARAWFV